MAILRHALYIENQDRAASEGKGPIMINCFPEIISNKEKDNAEANNYIVVKRPGIVEHDDVVVLEGGSAEARGMYTFNGSLYSIFDDTVYKDGTALATVMDDSSGRCYFDEIGGATPRLVIQDPTNSKLYITNSGETNIVKQTLTNGPAASWATGVVVLDGYIMIGRTVGIIHNSDTAGGFTGDQSGWTADNNLSAEVLPDPLVAIRRHANYLCALGEDSIEFFFDSADAAGSPFSRLEGTTNLVGCAAGDTPTNCDDELLFVAKSKDGGRFVGRIKGFTHTRVSTAIIDEYLDAEKDNIGDAYGMYIRTMGHRFYALTLPTTADTTLMYDLDEDVWHEWTTTDFVTHFAGMYVTSDVGLVLVQHETNGKIYELSPTAYQDDGENDIPVRIQTKNIDGEVNQAKFCSRLEVIGDRETTSGDILISYSDNDYTTYSTQRTVDISSVRRYLLRLGAFERRSFRIEYNGNSPMRLEALELNVRRGHYGQT